MKEIGKKAGYVLLGAAVAVFAFSMFGKSNHSDTSKETSTEFAATTEVTEKNPENSKPTVRPKTENTQEAQGADIDKSKSGTEDTKRENSEIDNNVSQKQEEPKQESSNESSGSGTGLQDSLDSLNRQAESAYDRILENYDKEVAENRESSGSGGGTYSSAAGSTGTGRSSSANSGSASVCSKCKGAGTVMCTSCKGVGKKYYTKYTSTYGNTSGSGEYTQTVQCPTCRGTGSSICTLCGGTGGN